MLNSRLCLIDTFRPSGGLLKRPAFHSMIWPLSATATAAEALTADGNDGWPTNSISWYSLPAKAHHSRRLSRP